MTRIRGPAAIAVMLAAVVVAGWSSLNNDVTYALGGMQTAGRGGVSVWNVFVARPLFYRLPLAGMDALRGLFTRDPHGTVAERLIRAETDLIIVIVAVVLFRGLKRFLGTRPAAFTAVGAGLALAVAPPWHFLEPDWLATLAAVLAVGAACTTNRAWLGGILGGLAAWLTIAIKLATIPTALLALLLIAVLNRRRAVWTTAATAVFTLVWYLTTKHFLPWEWTWLHDQAALVQNAPMHTGVTVKNVRELFQSIGDTAVLSPFVAVAPAAAVILIRFRQPGTERRLAAALTVAATGLSIGSGYGQGEFYQYHFAPVPVLAAGAGALAFARAGRAGVSLIIATAVFTAAGAVLLWQPDKWRLAHYGTVLFLYAAASAVTVLTAYFLDRPRPRGVRGWPAGAAVFSAALVLASVPGAPYAFSAFDNEIIDGPPGPDTYAALRDRIGPDTPVMYLSFGAIDYRLGNPTTCRYPSPQWVQRANRIAIVATYRSYADNLRCLQDERSARYLILQNDWFGSLRANPAVYTLINDRFDCRHPLYYAALGLTVCPVRPKSAGPPPTISKTVHKKTPRLRVA